MANIALISDTRSGSTALCDYIRLGLNIRDLGEIFYPYKTKDDDIFNYYNSYKFHDGSLKKFFKWILTTQGGGMISKILYHDFCLGISHPRSLTYSFPIIDALSEGFDIVLHLKRKSTLESSLSEIIASNTSMFHSKEAQNNLNINKVYIDLKHLKNRIEARLDSQLIADTALNKYCSLPVYDIYYEDFFLGNRHLLITEIFPQFDTSTQLVFKKVILNYADWVDNYDELIREFPDLIKVA